MALLYGPTLVEFKESVENKLIRVPGVLHSVTRSHGDGSVAMVLVNITDQAQTLSVPVDPKLRGATLLEHSATLQRMDQSGTRTELGAGREPWNQPVSLKPLEVCFLILK